MDNPLSQGQSGPNIDYIRIPASCSGVSINGNKRMNLKPGDYEVIIKDSKNHAVKKSFTVSEVEPFTIVRPEIDKAGPKSIVIKDPSPGFTYEFYQEDAPLFYSGQYEKPLETGNRFSPPGPGNYYIAAKNISTGAESSNRIGIAIDKTPKDGEGNEINPLRLGKKSILLWFDASDADGDGKDDGTVPERGPAYLKEKIHPDESNLFVKYEPNVLNGKGIGGLDDVWVQSIGKEVHGFQTIIMVYKESSLSFPGKSPFIGLSKYIGKSEEPGKRMFDLELTDQKTRDGKTWLNGKKVDPFTTPNPMDYCILMVELGSVADNPILKTEGYWEGSLAEILILNRTLNEKERRGIEEYLRKKWFSSIDLDF